MPNAYDEELLECSSTDKPAGPLVAVLAYDGLCTFEFGVAVEVFGLARPELGADWYRFRVVAERPGPMEAAGGIRVSGDVGLEGLEDADLIMIPGWRGIEASVPEDLCEAVRRSVARGARILTICSGVVVPAAAGVLDGRRATTHWRYTDALAARFPKIEIGAEVLYVEDGPIVTSAGSAAGLDLCLHVVRSDYGPAVANRVARRLVIPPHRDGGQAQFIDRPVPKQQGTRFAHLFDWLRAHLAEPITVDRMADRAAMSRRSFIRRFQAATGQSPAAWLAGERVALARTLLEETDFPVERIVAEAGFGSTETLRHQFKSRLKTSPSAYRKRFRRAA
jgi:AraC family transcriptional activator FtrA